MPSIRFSWNQMLVDLRREVCPRARWQKQTRCWVMSDAEAEAFVRAAHTRLEFGKWQADIQIDEVTWIVGFAHGAPYRRSTQLAQPNKAMSE